MANYFVNPINIYDNWRNIEPLFQGFFMYIKGEALER